MSATTAAPAEDDRHPREEFGVIRAGECRECGAPLGGLVATTVADAEFVCLECHPPDATPGFGVHVCPRRDVQPRWHPGEEWTRLHDGDA